MKRFREFHKVLKLEKAPIKALFIGFLKILPFFMFRKRNDRLEWARRYKTCLRCPIFDKDHKRCRPWSGSSRGCGCYVPFSNIIYEECWGRTKYGNAIGWSAYDEESWLRK